MATHDKTLTPPPTDERQRELWLQHGAGLILFEDVRNYAIEQLEDGLSDEARAAALKAIDDAVYGTMMVIDGVTGALRNETHCLSLEVHAQLTELESEQTLLKLNLADGDGMCMGYHGWREGDFGNHPPAES